MPNSSAAYANNYAKAAAYYLRTCAPMPAEACERAAYSFITSLYKSIIDDASVLGLKLAPDTFFADGEGQKGREKDVKTIRDPIAKIEQLIDALLGAAMSAEPTDAGLALAAQTKLPKPFVKLLAAVGCDVQGGVIAMPRECAEGIMKLCRVADERADAYIADSNEDKRFICFSRCVFDPRADWIARAFDALIGADGGLVRLCGELEARGYRRIDCREGRRISLDYVKPHGKDEPVKAAWAERAHTGIELKYEELKRDTGCICVRMPMYKTVLSRFGELPEDAAGFLLAHTKRCNGCRYCVQTDKTDKRPLAAIELRSERLCPLYPGFGMSFHELTEELGGSILAVLSAVDGVLEGK